MNQKVAINAYHRVGVMCASVRTYCVWVGASQYQCWYMQVDVHNHAFSVLVCIPLDAHKQACIHSIQCMCVSVGAHNRVNAVRVDGYVYHSVPIYEGVEPNRSFPWKLFMYTIHLSKYIYCLLKLSTYTGRRITGDMTSFTV